MQITDKSISPLRNCSLHTNLEPARLFCKPALTDTLKQWLIPGAHFFHVTVFKHIPSLMKQGLDPAYGGIEGAGARTNLEDFCILSKGLVHAATHASGTQTYIKLYELGSFKSGWYAIYGPCTTLAEAPLVLRFPKRLEGVVWSPDEDDPNGVKTPGRIKPEYIEALTTEGWVPLFDLIEVENAIQTAPAPAPDSAAELDRLRKKYPPFDPDAPFYPGCFF